MNDLVIRVRAAFQADQHRIGVKVTSPNELPQRYEDLTSEWFTAVLCKDRRSARVADFQIVGADSGSSNRARIALTYVDPQAAEGLPRALFCKASQSLANRIILGTGAGAAECNFYNHIRPYLDLEAPRGWFARYDEDTFNSIILLNDLTEHVTAFCSHRTVVTRAMAESQMRLLAALHGGTTQTSNVRQALRRYSPWSEVFLSWEAFGMKEGSNQGFLDGEEVIPARLYRRFTEIWPATAASARRHDHLPQSLAHGDVHLKNWYIAADGSMGLSDWQCASLAHWSRDVAYTISTALSVEDRRMWERDLVQYFLEELGLRGGDMMDFDSAFRLYREGMLTSLAQWTVTLAPAANMPDMQPRDTTLEFIRRIAGAADDLESLDVHH